MSSNTSMVHPAEVLMIDFLPTRLPHLSRRFPSSPSKVFNQCPCVSRLCIAYRGCTSIFCLDSEEYLITLASITSVIAIRWLECLLGQPLKPHHFGDSSFEIWKSDQLDAYETAITKLFISEDFEMFEKHFVNLNLLYCIGQCMCRN
ncbi:unnamed protein product [Albugo candida]|uniref:Uncharacterized protein n=1 Tax=Albugo candida TaxID=65357 RepID=A0A024GMP0_9STRA|nr:unnamed protein product [Albugo candida]|eukprot:CCI47613.1 unnamed protein product [Albugo candida]